MPSVVKFGSVTVVVALVNVKVPNSVRVVGSEV